MPQRVSILGATGSIGQQAFDVIRQRPGECTIVGLAAGHDTPALRALITEFHPEIVAIAAGENTAGIGVGATAINEVASVDVDCVLVAIPGMAALAPTLAAIEAGNDIALASKEVLVAAGRLVNDRLKKFDVRMYPVDSEHSAIWQSSRGDETTSIRQLWLTASGGAFRDTPIEQLASVTAEQAMRHPTWNMGPKVTIDSASMMNKGLEMIEAHHLFHVGYDEIQVVIHRESIIHSLVEYHDGGFLAALSHPDMRLPIALAIRKGVRGADVIPALRFEDAMTLNFEPADPIRYPAIELARSLGRKGGSWPCAMNAANEVAVETFLAGGCAFTDIIPIIEGALGACNASDDDSLDAIEAIDFEVRTHLRRTLQHTASVGR